MFSVNKDLLKQIAIANKEKQPMEKFKNKSTLSLIQSVSTIPIAFPTKMNTCGRVCVHTSGNFVIVSNRGHESIAIFRVERKGSKKGCLRRTGFFHTRGETPRHFQFDFSGQYLVVANQDSNTIAVFSFNMCTGEIVYTGNEYRVPSPNFVCSCPVVASDNERNMEEDDELISLIMTEKDQIPSFNQNNNLLQLELKIAYKKIMELEDRLSTLL